MATKVIPIDEQVYIDISIELEQLNVNALREYRDQYKLADEKQRKKLVKPQRLTLKAYSEAALDYFRKNHLDPRNLGEETDVISEVRKLRNNVFSFMQVQERTHLIPFVEEVYQVKSKIEILEENSFDLLNLMEIFIDMMLNGLGLSEEEQSNFRAKAMKQFQQNKANRIKQS